jgi:putative transcriptional regulator
MLYNYDKKMEGIVMFSEQVKHVRKILDYSQDKLAQILGVSFATINRWENSKNTPSKLAQKSFYDFCESNFIDVEELKKL